MASTSLVLLTMFAAVTTVVGQFGELPDPDGLSPRFYLGLQQPQLEQRQSGNCGSNSHSCLDVNATVCCPNTQYCFIDPDYNAKCCDIGSNCDSTCPSSLYQCESSTTISGTATVTAGCCARTCPSVSAFKCATEYGGGCCSFGYSCGSGGQCLSTIQPTTSNAIVSVVPSGCTTSQFACPTSLGGGCCNNGLSCTVLDNTNYCVSASGSAVRTGSDSTITNAASKTPKSSGLSVGAKAGIGAGIAVGFCLVAVGILWFCICQRRRARRSQHSSSAPAMSQGSGSAPSNRPAGRQPADYFGPAATAGPYTGGHESLATSPGYSRGVPATPQSPGDIATPVEIDSRDHSNVTSPGSLDYLKYPGAAEHQIELP